MCHRLLHLTTRRQSDTAKSRPDASLSVALQHPARHSLCIPKQLRASSSLQFAVMSAPNGVSHLTVPGQRASTLPTSPVIPGQTLTATPLPSPGATSPAPNVAAANPAPTLAVPAPVKRAPSNAVTPAPAATPAAPASSASSSSSSSGSSRPPVRKVGKYLLGKTLGQGTFGKVKYATDSESGRAVAIKMMDKAKIRANNMGDQIKKEISILKLIKHPNVIQLIEVLASQTTIYIVLEVVTGGELFDKIIEEGHFSEDEARHYFRQLIDGIEKCHEAGVCHRGETQSHTC